MLGPELSRGVGKRKSVQRDLQRPYTPLPLIGMVGFLHGRDELLSSGRWSEGDRLFLVGTTTPALDGGSYLMEHHGILKGRPTEFISDSEQEFAERAIRTAHTQAATSGRPISGGGLVMALAQEAILGTLGAQVRFPTTTRRDVVLFGEGGPRALYAVPTDQIDKFRSIWKGFPYAEIGIVEGDSLIVENLVDISVLVLQERWGL